MQLSSVAVCPCPSKLVSEGEYLSICAQDSRLLPVYKAAFEYIEDMDRQGLLETSIPVGMPNKKLINTIRRILWNKGVALSGIDYHVYVSDSKESTQSENVLFIFALPALTGPKKTCLFSMLVYPDSLKTGVTIERIQLSQYDARTESYYRLYDLSLLTRTPDSKTIQ